MWSLVWVLAVLPGLYAIEYRSLTTTDAAWGLRAFEHLNREASNPDAAGASSGRSIPLASLPPLSTWLTAFVMQVMGTERAVSLVLVSYLAGAGSVIVFAHLVSDFAGPRTGMMAAAVACCHAPLLTHQQHAGPATLAVFLGLLALRGALQHLRFETSLTSLRLLMAGLALGACLLAAGLWVVVVSVSFLVLGYFQLQTARNRQPSLGPALSRMFVSLGMLWLTMFAVGGWWYLMLSQQQASEWEWVTRQFSEPIRGSILHVELGDELGKAKGTGPSIWTWAAPGWLTGLWLIALTRLVRVAVQDDRSRTAECRMTRLLLSWLIVSVVVHAILSYWSVPNALLVSFSSAWLQLVVLAVTVWGINEMTEMRVAWWQIATAAVIGLLVVTIGDYAAIRIPTGIRAPLLAIALVAIALTTTTYLLSLRQDTDAKERLIVGCLLVGQFLLHAATSMATTRSDSDPYLTTLNSLAHAQPAKLDTAESPAASEAVCVSPLAMPAEMRYTLRALVDGRPVRQVAGIPHARSFLASQVQQPSPAGDRPALSSDALARSVLMAEWTDDMETSVAIEQLGWHVEQESPFQIIGQQPFHVRIVTWRPKPAPTSATGR